MTAYFSKPKDQILRQALKKLSDTTTITNVGPGSIARALVEVITDELGEFSLTLDFNMSQSVLSSASGRALDLLGQLYNVERKRLTDLATLDASMGAFYFYIESPYFSDVIVPRGTRVSTRMDAQLGGTFVYATTDQAVIFAGRLRAYASIRPIFEDSVFTAGANTLVEHTFTGGPPGMVISCTNPKAIEASVGYELDADYRLRIIKSVRTAAGGTTEALRFAILAIPGIRDVRMRQTPYGLGSYEALIVAEDYGLSQGLAEIVRGALDKLRPVGTRMFVRLPDLQHVDLKAAVSLKPGMTTTNAANISRRIENALLRYLNSLTVGEILIYNKMISYVIETTDIITDITFTKYAVNGQEVLRKNFSPKEDQHLIPGNIEVTIL